jgi:hypothetical protein
LLDEYAALSKRKQDVLIGTFGTVIDRFEVKLPAGYRVVDAPDEVSVDNRFGSYAVRVSQRDESVTVESRLTIKVARVAPGEYAAWRSFCQDFDNAVNARLSIGK